MNRMMGNGYRRQGVGTQTQPTCNSCGRNNPLQALYELDFAITDTVMYLDMYPDSVEAQEHLSKLRSDRVAVVAEFERYYGPLTIYSANCGNKNGGLMPWQYGYGETR